MSSTICYIFEDAQTDRQFNQQANAAYNKIVAWLKNPSNKKIRVLPSLYVDFLYKDVYPQHSDDLAIILSSKNEYNGQYFPPPSNIIQIRCNKLEDFFTAEKRNTFVHEFVHYLDFTQRIKNQNIPTYDPDTEKREYYNSPHEYNAFVHAGLSSYIKYVSKDINQLRKYKASYRQNKDTPDKYYYKDMISEYAIKIVDAFYLDYPENGIMHIRGYMRREFLDNLTPQNTQRLNKRLTKFFDATVKRLSNIPEIADILQDNKDYLKKHSPNYNK